MGNCHNSPIYSIDDGINMMEELKQNYKVSSYVYDKSNGILVKMSLLKNSSKSDEEKEDVFNQYYKYECEELLGEIDNINKTNIMDKIDEYITQHNCIRKITGKCAHKVYMNNPIWTCGYFSYYNNLVLTSVIEAKYKDLYKKNFKDNYILEDGSIKLKNSCALCSKN